MRRHTVKTSPRLFSMEWAPEFSKFCYGLSELLKLIMDLLLIPFHWFNTLTSLWHTSIVPHTGISTGCPCLIPSLTLLNRQTTSPISLLQCLKLEMTHGQRRLVCSIITVKPSNPAHKWRLTWLQLHLIYQYYTVLQLALTLPITSDERGALVS